MARKSTKKSEETAEKKETKKTTTKKTATKKTATKKETKQDKKVKLTFRPIFSAATNFTAYLQRKQKIVDNGNELLVDKPIIEGLPGVLTVRAGEIIEVTLEQLEQLIELQFVESEEQISNRKAIEKGLEPQHPERLSYDVMASNRDFNIKPRELEKLYTDKLIVVD